MHNANHRGVQDLQADEGFPLPRILGTVFKADLWSLPVSRCIHGIQTVQLRERPMGVLFRCGSILPGLHNFLLLIFLLNRNDNRNALRPTLASIHD